MNTNPTVPTLIRVILIEDNAEYAEVVKLALNNEPDIKITHQFGTSEIAIRQLNSISLKHEPDLILLDIRLPGMSGLDSIPLLRQSLPNVKIMILSQSNQEPDVLKAISLGADGYLLKSATLDELTHGIRTVIAGGATLDPSVAKFILASLQAKLPANPESLTVNTKNKEDRILSDRELQILTLLADGFVKKEIANQLSIGYSTVDTHVSRIYSKLNVCNAPSAVNKAHRLNLFSRSEK